MAVFYYFSRSDLESALGQSVVESIYDDDHSGQADVPSIDACRAYGTTLCKSYIRANYGDDQLPADELSVPDELLFAALDFGIAYTMRRRPDLVRAMGEESWTTFMTSAREQMKNYAATLQRLARADAVPANVGVTVGTSTGTLTTTSARCRTTRKFDDVDKFF